MVGPKGLWNSKTSLSFHLRQKLAPDLSSGQALHDNFDNRCSKISFCSTVARIWSFHVNLKPVGYTWTNTAGLVDGLSFSINDCCVIFTRGDNCCAISSGVRIS